MSDWLDSSSIVEPIVPHLHLRYFLYLIPRKCIETDTFSAKFKKLNYFFSFFFFFFKNQSSISKEGKGSKFDYENKSRRNRRRWGWRSITSSEGRRPLCRVLWCISASPHPAPSPIRGQRCER